MNHISIRASSNYLPIRHEGHSFFMVEGRILKQTGDAPADSLFVQKTPDCTLDIIMIQERDLIEAERYLLQAPAISGQVLDIFYENQTKDGKTGTRVRGISCSYLLISFPNRPPSDAFEGSEL